MGVLRGCNVEVKGTSPSDMGKSLSCTEPVPWSQLLQMMDVPEDGVALLPVTNLLGYTESFERYFCDEAR